MSAEQSMSGARADLMSRVHAAVTDTPYVLMPTQYGFDLSVDVQTPVWQGLLSRQSVEKVFVHRVTIDEQNTTISINDALFELAWVAGVPQIGAELSTQQGRTVEKSGYITFGGDEGAERESYSFDSEEGRKLIVDAAKELGWTVERSSAERVGIMVAIIAVVIVGLVAIGLGIWALISAFG